MTTSTDTDGCGSDAAAIIEAVRDLSNAAVERTDTPAGEAVYALVPAGMQAVSVRKFADEYATKPERRKGTAKFMDEDSFNVFVQRFANPATLIFALPSLTQPSVTAVLDYHPHGPENTDAAHAEFRALYTCPLDDAWKHWISKNGEKMTQADFAAFIEDRIQDISLVDPEDPKLAELAEKLGVRFASPTELVALSRGLQVNIESVVREAVTLSTGEISVQFAEQHTDGRGQPVLVPNAFVIAIPVFYGMEPWRIVARLRYRANQGRIVWWYQLHRADRAFDEAFHETTNHIEDVTGVRVLYGTPER